MIRKVSAEDIAIRGNGTGLEYMCPTWHFVYIFFNPVFQVSTAKNEINLFNNHILIVAPVTFAPAGAMTPSAEFLSFLLALLSLFSLSLRHYENMPIPIQYNLNDLNTDGSFTLDDSNSLQSLQNSSNSSRKQLFRDFFLIL